MTDPSKYTEAERADIFAYASGDRNFQAEAIAAHRAMRARVRFPDLPFGDPYFRFMQEVDNPAPDLFFRARFRIAIIKGGLK